MKKIFLLIIFISVTAFSQDTKSLKVATKTTNKLIIMNDTRADNWKIYCLG